MFKVISQQLPKDLYDLRKDGRLLFRGTELECMHELHNHFSGSADWAMKYEGYTISPIAQDWRDHYQWCGGEQ